MIFLLIYTNLLSSIYILLTNRYLGVNLKIEEIKQVGFPILEYQSWRLQGKLLFLPYYHYELYLILLGDTTTDAAEKEEQ